MTPKQILDPTAVSEFYASQVHIWELPAPASPITVHSTFSCIHNIFHIPMDLLQNSLDFMLMYPNLLQLVGVLGFLTYVIGFALVQNEKICGNGVLYPASKVVAAFCVLVSLVGAFNLASCLIQLSYIVIGLYGIAVRRKKNRADTQTVAEPDYATSPENMFVLSDVSHQTTQQAGFGRFG